MHGPPKKSTRPPCRLSEAQDHPTHSCCICLQAGFTCVCEMSLLFMSRVGFGWQQSALVMRQCLHLDDDNPRRPDSFTVACVIERCCEFETDTMLQVWVDWLLCCCYAAIVLWDNMSVKCHGKCCHNWSWFQYEFWFANVKCLKAQSSETKSTSMSIFNQASRWTPWDTISMMHAASCFAVSSMQCRSRLNPNIQHPWSFMRGFWSFDLAFGVITICHVVLKWNETVWKTQSAT